MTNGTKQDGEKLKWNLFPLKVMEGVVRAFMYGARKYKPHDWQFVPNGRERYFEAAMRHLAQLQAGEQVDPESGLDHLDHAICSLIIMRYHVNKNRGA